MTRRDADKAVEVFAPSAPHFAAIAADIETAVTDELEKALSEPVTAERFVAHVAHEATVAAAFARFMIALRRKIGIRESLIVDAEAALPAARQALVAALRAISGSHAVAANLWDGALVGMAVMREHLSGSLGVACSLISS